MRRAALIVSACALALAGCGGGQEVAPTAVEVEGTVPTETAGQGGEGTTGQTETGGAGVETKTGGGQGGAGGETETGGQGAAGDAKAGKSVFTASGCGACHVFKAAGTAGTTGPDLDKSLQGKDAGYIQESITDPDAKVPEGYQPGIMPKTYDEQLSDKQLSDLVAFLTPKS